MAATFLVQLIAVVAMLGMCSVGVAEAHGADNGPNGPNGPNGANGGNNGTNGANGSGANNGGSGAKKGKFNGGAYWGSFSRGECVQPGYRKYSSRLWNIGGDWTTACSNTEATVEGTYFLYPDNCVNTGINGEWGEFLVRDSWCDHSWGTFQDDGCKGDGRRQVSSVLYGIPPGQSWEAWCDRAWAQVDGVAFQRPSRCVNVGPGINMWGQFDVPDPCCGNADADDSPTASIHTELRRRRRSLLQTDGDTCVAAAGGPGGLPPNDPNKDPSTPSDAIDVFGNPTDFDAWLASVFLLVTSAFGSSREDLWTVSVPPDNAGRTDYDVFQVQGDGRGLRFINSDSGLPLPQGAKVATVPALVVPVVPATRLLNGGSVFSSGQWQSISLTSNNAHPNPLRIIATSQLGGCCIATGFDPDTSTFYMGHAQPVPDGGLPQVSSGENLANLLRTQPQPFQGVTLDRVRYIGRPYGGFNLNADRANIIGILGRRAVFIIVQYLVGWQIVGHDFFEFP